ncbi:MAG: hypothetical protein JW936_08980 [Sedimentisphaerales bacterium]|nr:hypothetical protein [Sedimentisphaerales bacterium]
MIARRILLLLSVILVGWFSAGCLGQEAVVLEGVTVSSARAMQGEITSPAVNVVDGDAGTNWEWTDFDHGAEVVLDLGKPCRVEGLVLTNGTGSNRSLWALEVHVGNGGELDRELLYRQVNLVTSPGARTEIVVAPAVGRYVTVKLMGTGLAEIEVLGRENLPERHLCGWTLNIQGDYLDKIDYLSDELGVTDIWLDYVETAWPQTNYSVGLDSCVETGAFEQFAQHGIRYWLGEHEFFTCLVDSPEMLENDQVWQRCFMQARQVYARARDLGFTGLVWDGETYANEMAWRYTQHWGPDGLYYQRGLQYGTVLKEVWDCEVIQMWEGRLFGNYQLVGGAEYVTQETPEDYQQGNYWFLKGISDAGIRVSMALEKTYGAGNSEMPSSVEGLIHLNQYYLHMPDFYVNLTYEAYPFLYRVLPGFHPWNCRTRLANYLPRYLDEQLDWARETADGYWIYTEGLPSGGDPRETLDAEALAEYGVTAQDYVDVFDSHPTERTE